jgi:DNA gyrase subunit A
MAIIKAELLAIKEKHATPRMTEIVPDEGEIAIEDLIANEGVIITITHNGLIKRTNVSQLPRQRRGGKGVIGMATREGRRRGEDADFIEHLFTASTHDYLMFFTNTGACMSSACMRSPTWAAPRRAVASPTSRTESRREDRRAHPRRFPRRTEPEDQTWQQSGELFFATRLGTVKKTALSDFGNVRKGGIIAISIEEGDTLIDVKLTAAASSRTTRSKTRATTSCSSPRTA